MKTHWWLLPACLALCACRQPMPSVAQAGADTADGGALAKVGMMTTPRAAHTATALADGQVLIAGGMTGRGDAVAGAELYDPAADRFTGTGAMRTSRHSHTATRLADGRVLFAGGYDADGAYLASAELYDPATDTFIAAGTMGEARAGHVAIGLDDGRVLLYASTEVFDPDTGRFTPAVEMTVRRHKHDAVLLRDGRVLVTGGTDERDADGIYDSAEILDLRGGTAARTAPMQRPRYKHVGTSVTLPDGRVLIAGGASEAELFDMRTQSFTVVPGKARMAGQFAAVAPLAGGRVLVTGGYGHDIAPQADTWIYRP